ncbi:hypothetical protein HYW44_02350 [Candidatus Daviesbacteria bacterium]|nr:hypothetical protein [Candidatus Daviesbacteria bacterium]
MNSKIAMSGLSILASLAIMGGATFAFFSDSGTSSGNTFSSGNLDMKLSDGNQEDQENVTGTWGLNSAPGDTFTGDLRITNTGSVPANHVELKFTNIVTEAVSGPGTVSTTPMDRVIEITVFEWDSDGDGVTDVTIPVTDLNSNGITDLDDLENQVADDFDNLAFTGTQTADHVLRISGRLSPTLAVDQHQGDSVSMSLDVTMNQDASQ